MPGNGKRKFFTRLKSVISHTRSGKMSRQTAAAALAFSYILGSGSDELVSAMIHYRFANCV
jgi:hypothetical protein